MNLTSGNQYLIMAWKTPTFFTSGIILGFRGFISEWNRALVIPEQNIEAEWKAPRNGCGVEVYTFVSKLTVPIDFFTLIIEPKLILW